MTLAEELLEAAQIILDADGPPAQQAIIRRSVATAYYALFHLLIGEAIENWVRPEFRSILGRLFERGTMRSVSEKIASEIGRQIKGKVASNAEPTLHLVGWCFIRSRQRRIEADYVRTREWARSNADEQIRDVANAFAAWQQIRNEPAAQAYLVAMLNKRAS